ncbi:nitroreductase [Desulfovibrio aminophilus]|nr:nitroreductase [Desulfovibrio aminophilus]MCM0754998.1 nitroreductase [Desulfovibrio aminophilus]
MPLENPVLTAIRERRSIRRYSADSVSREEIEAILEAGRWAPSGLNHQAWRFLVLRPDDPRRDALAGLTKYAHILEGAKALVCVFLDRSGMYHPMKDHQGAGACLQNMLLAAHSLGLGAVWIGEIVNQEPHVTEALGLNPADLELQAVVALGRPDQKGSADRKPLAQLLLEDIP